MKIRELLRLATGTYKLTDGNYVYSLIKFRHINEASVFIYQIKEFGGFTSGRITFHEYMEKETETYPEYKYKRLRASVFISGLTISSKDTSEIIRTLKFVPKTSYKEWLKHVEQ